MTSLTLSSTDDSLLSRERFDLVHRFIAKHGSIRPDITNIAVTSSNNDQLLVNVDGTTATIQASRPIDVIRGLTALHGGIVQGAYHETRPFDSLGIMLDCSRNAVMRPDVLINTWIPRLALLGYNQLMLYTEDTYEIPEQPFFGYQRGRYTLADIQAIDAAAAAWGVEVVGCIQTLAHLKQIFRHPGLENLIDHGSTMMIGQPEVYELVGHMLDVWSSGLGTRRIHIGMDEAWDMGRGKYLDEHGQVDRYELFCEHLQRVTDMCTDRGLEPMIWSDMVYTQADPEKGFYRPEAQLRADAAKHIPDKTRLVYWDYYDHNTTNYEKVLNQHNKIGGTPVMAAGTWTWSSLWYDRFRSEPASSACIDACRRTRTRELVFTMWGDDGAYCDMDSAWLGLAWSSLRCTTKEAVNADSLYPAVSQWLSALHRDAAPAQTLAACDLSSADIQLSAFIWDDPLTGIMDTVGVPPDSPLAIEDIPPRMDAIVQATKTGDPTHPFGDLDHAKTTALTIAAKIRLRRALKSAFNNQDKPAIPTLRRDTHMVISHLTDLQNSFRRMWMRNNRPQGIESMQIRLAGQIERHHELLRRLSAWQAGEENPIPELLEKVPQQTATGFRGKFHIVATPSIEL